MWGFGLSSRHGGPPRVGTFWSLPVEDHGLFEVFLVFVLFLSVCVVLFCCPVRFLRGAPTCCLPFDYGCLSVLMFVSVFVVGVRFCCFFGWWLKRRWREKERERETLSYRLHHQVTSSPSPEGWGGKKGKERGREREGVCF